MLRFNPSQIIYTLLLSLFFILNSVKDSQAGIVPPVKDSLYGSQIVANASFDVINSEFTLTPNPLGWTSGIVHKKLMNQLSFSFNPVGLKHLTSTYILSLDLEVKYWNETNRTYTSPLTLPQITLEIQYDPAAGIKYKDKDVYYFEGAHQIEVKIVGVHIQSNGSQLSSIPTELQDRLKLESSITSLRFEPLNLGSPVITSTPDNGEIKFNWSEVKGAEAYDLEWTFVNNYKGYDINGNIDYETNLANLKFDFLNNSTKVRVTGLEYKIPQIYERGYVVYRVRGIGKIAPDYVKDLPGSWSKAITTGSISMPNADVLSATNCHFHISSGEVHEGDKKNWQYTVNFAEEGKNKGVIKYLDGSQRSRQVVTRISTENKAIVGEVIYDESGRPVLDVLPVPANESKIKYYNKFNQYTPGVAYTNKQLTQPTSTNCVPSAESMSTGSGASQYYSDQNPDTKKQQAYVPDAGRYPFSQTQYTMDNTGRVRAKGGVGDKHQLGSGHETKYYYGTPTPEELKRLFGKEVGKAEHYKKNITIDANGQISVTYLDPKGNTIATALAGSSPTNLIALSSNQSTSMDINLLGDNINAAEGNALISNNTLIVSGKQVSHNFQYTVTGKNISDPICLDGVCYKGKYYLTIYITDACGNRVFSLERHPIGALDLVNTSCPGDAVTYNTSSLPSPFSMILDAGSYNITKILAVDEYAVDEYVESYLANTNNTCVLSEQDFIDVELAKINQTNCNITCDDCKNSVNAKWQHTNASLTNFITKEKYDELIANCDQLCITTPTDQCDLALKTMLADVSPGGQYAQYKDTINCSTDVALFPLSILNNSNSNYKPGNHWKNPGSTYIENDGSASFIEIKNGKPLTDDGSIILLEDGREVVQPQNLADVEDFINYWKPSWANSLVQYHPEYGIYGWCKTISKSNEWDEKMMNTSSYSAALAAGYVNTGTVSPVAPCTLNINIALNNDDYFKPGGVGADQMCDMQKAMNEFAKIGTTTYNIFQLAAASVNCSSEKTEPAYHTCIAANTFGSNTNTAIKDNEWQIYRSFYLSLKQKFQAKKRSAFTIANGSYNECIGNGNFNPFENGFNTIYRTSSQPCGIGSAYLFSNKTPRFPGINNLIKNNIDFYGDGAYLAKKGKEYVDRALYNKCGKCPNAIYLETMLAGLGGRNKLLVANTTLNTIPEFSPLKGALSGNTTLDYIWSPISYSSNQLSGRITQSSFCCKITLNTLSGTIDWSKIGNFSGIEATGTNDFYIYAENKDDGSLVKLVGHIDCLTLTGCIIIPKCKESQAALDLRNIFNSLLKQPVENSNHFITGITFSTSTSHINYLTTTLKAELHPEQGEVTSQWQVTVNNLGDFSGQLNMGTASCYFTFKILPLSQTTYTMDDIESFLFIEPHPGNLSSPNKHAIITARTKSGKIIEIQLENSCYVIGQCGNPEKKCDNDMETGDDRRRNLLSFLNTLTMDNKLVYNNPSNPLNLETYTSFTPLKDIITKQTSADRQWSSQISTTTTSTLTGLFNSASGCSLTLTCLDNRIQFQEIDYFKNLTVTPTGMDNALANNFTVEAYTKCGSRITLTGSINCFQIANCKLCPSQVLKSDLVSNDGMGDCRDGMCKPAKKLPAFSVTGNPCLTYMQNVAKLNGKTLYNSYIDSLRKVMKFTFTEQLLQATETFRVTYSNPEHHYTLYYYDQANNLVKTVPPQGVVPFTTLPTPLSNPAHTYVTHYKYNSLNQLVEQTTPDAGTSKFYYDQLGRMMASQNAKQAPLKKYSYTLYDALGRIKEVGEVSSTTNIDVVTDSLFNKGFIDRWVAARTRSEITRTYYDAPIAGVNNYFEEGQQNLRSRVATTTYQDVNGSNYDFATHYSYDIHGNVQTLIQENKSLAHLDQSRKKIEYAYDLISGKVNMVIYQRGKSDQFMHRYSYDADNRIIMVETSKDSIIWDKDGKYFYYQHGPLARTEIGEHKVQGLDYAYTIQGWLKGVNSNTLSAKNDMGNDGFYTSYAYNITNGGSTVNLHEKFARDAFGFTLSYFKDDYKSVSLTDKFQAALVTSGTNSGFETASKDLYNGNIRHMVTAVGKLMAAGKSQGTVYRYDQLNRLKSMDVYNNIDTTLNKWLTGSAITDYHSYYTYDANGNIVKLQRNGTTQNSKPLNMDSLGYNYIAGTNKLKYVTDVITNTNYTTDVDNQATDNYDYDEIGNLKQDKQEEIALIEWTVYGKIKKITRTTGSTKPNLEFFYGPDGNRVAKVVKYGTDPVNWKYTAYVRDAQGNVMATYTQSLQKRVAPQQSDYPAVMTALKNELGTTAYDSYIPGTYCPQSWFISNLKTSIRTNSYTSTVIQPYPNTWYAENDATVKANVLSQLTDDDLAAAVLRQQPEIILQHYFQQSGLQTLQLIQSFVCSNASLFLTQLSGQDPNVIDYLYNYFYPGQPHPPLMDMINDLASQQSCSDLATQIDYYNNTYWTGGWLCINVIKLYPATDIYNNLIGLYGGSFTSIRGYLEGQPSIITLLNLDNPNTINSVVQLLSNDDKLDLVATYDPCNLSQNAMNTSRTMVEDVIKNNYSITNFLGDVKANQSLTVYKNMMITVFGMVGEMQEKLFLDELQVYGSSRMGTITANKQLVMKDYDGTVSMQTGLGLPITIYQEAKTDSFHILKNKYYTRFIGDKRYELSNHLGNVLAVVSDKKVSVPVSCSTSVCNIAWYEPEVITANDYYPFGSIMPERSFSLQNVKYRYGFNGKENDNEVKGDGNQQDYGMRIYDNRLGRFFSVDPLTSKFPELTPFQFASNTPIQAIDLDGLEAWLVKNKWNADYVNLFRNTLNKKISQFEKQQKVFTCDDLALECAINFAKTHNLPFKWKTDTRSFDASSTEYSDYKTFLNDVKSTSGAPDFAKPENTTKTNDENIKTGTLVVLKAEGRDRPNHIQVITNVEEDDLGIEGYNASQGNFTDILPAPRVWGSGDPESFRYLGTPIQKGYYNKDLDIWNNQSAGESTDNFFEDHYQGEYRDFNFEGMNK